MARDVTLADLGIVAIGGACGSLLRYGGTVAIGATPAGAGFPLGTLAVNLVGALLLGMLVAAIEGAAGGSGRWRATRLLLGTGALGGFTTYSAFAVDTAELLLAQRPGAALVYALLTLVAGAGASLAGIAIGGAGRRRKPGGGR